MSAAPVPSGRKMSRTERDQIISRLRPEFVDYHQRPIAYDFETFQNSWAERIHAMGCQLAVFRCVAEYQDVHYEAAVGTATSHWSTAGFATEIEEWNPPRHLFTNEWDDLIAIAHALGLSRLDVRRTYFEGNKQVTEVLRLIGTIDFLRKNMAELQKRFRRECFCCSDVIGYDDTDDVALCVGCKGCHTNRHGTPGRRRERRSVPVGVELFRFSSMQQWVDECELLYRNCGVPSAKTIALDAAGRVAVAGKEFQRADYENTYPVIVYALPGEGTKLLREAQGEG